MRRVAIIFLPLVVLLLSACALTRTTRATQALAAGMPAVTGPPVPVQPYTADPGPFPVATVEYTWTDTARNRDVPVKIYYPQTGAGPFPVIVFSHGLGGTREGYEYLGRHWASYGYVSVHPQHLGSDDAVWKGQADPLQAMKDSLKDLRAALNRPPDISFVLDQAGRLNREDPLFAGRLDLQREGMAGHSYGGWTTMAIAGELFLPGLRTISFADPRIKAAISMSAPPSPYPDRLDAAYSAIHLPILHMTGTKDFSIVTDSGPADKRVAFDHITGGDQFLVTFNGADHMTFSGHGALPGHELDVQFQPYILQVTTAFWDAYLKGDPAAKAWLTQGGWAAVLDGQGTWEQRLK